MDHYQVKKNKDCLRHLFHAFWMIVFIVLVFYDLDTELMLLAGSYGSLCLTKCIIRRL